MSDMTKKDYIAIAKIFKTERETLFNTVKDTYILGSSIITLDHLRDRLIDYMQADNKAFNKDKFIKACT